MAKVMVFDFGTINDTRRYRVNGERVDLERLLSEVKEVGGIFEGEDPFIEHVHKGLYSVYFKLKLPVGVGANAKNKNTNERNAFEKIYNNI